MNGRRAIVLLWLGSVLGLSAQAEEVTVCTNPEPPPSSYWKRDQNGQPTTELVGFSVELVRKAFAKLGIEVRYVANLPWVRCLSEVESGKLDFVMDGYFDAERAKRFSYSRPYRSLTPQVFFPRARPIQVSTRADLKRYRGCGVNGSSYAHYALAAADLDMGARSYIAMMEKLKLGRCDYAVEELEVIAALKYRGADYLADPAVARLPVRDAPAPARHLLTAKDGPRTALLPAFNQAILALEQSGESEALWQKHEKGLIPAD